MKLQIIAAIFISLLCLTGCQSTQPTTIPGDTAVHKEQIMCAEIYQPVCGADGNTYANECVATKQYKVDVAYQGECKIQDQATQHAATGDVSVVIKSDGKNMVTDMTQKQNMVAGETYTLTVRNGMDKEARFEIPQFNILIELGPNAEDVVNFTPKYKGFYPITINGNQLETLQIK